MPIGELMELVPLRARATCTSCLSKLPPRTEVYWDAAAQTATCLTCMHLILQEEATVEAEAHPEEPVVTVEQAWPEPVETDIDAPPAWGEMLSSQDEPRPAASDAEEGPASAPGLVPEAQPSEETEPEPIPGADLLGPAAPSPFTAAPRAVSHGLTIRRGAGSAGSREDPVSAETELDRGDMGEGRVGQTIEAARIHGLEVLHGFDVASGVHPIDHLVIAVNGIWVVRAQDVLTGRLERRDLGDWFSADPRLFVKDEDATHLIDETRRQVDALRARLGPTSFGDVTVRGVVCFGTAPAGWVSDPFDIANVKVTWRNLLVEPMLDPVTLDDDARLRLTTMLVTDRRRAKTA